VLGCRADRYLEELNAEAPTQLLVYLRLLDVPVPSVYGLTADEDPFGA
jgi:hypothetical protein